MTDGRGAEALDRGAAVPGEVRIGDRGDGRTPSLQRFLDGEARADVMVRTRPAGMTLLDRAGKRLDLAGHLATRPTDEVQRSAIDQPGTVRSGAADGPLQDASVGRAPVKPCAFGAPLRGSGA